MSKLFSAIRLAGQDFSNRVVVAPMCQYSADDGSANEWHLQNLMNLGMSGAGLVMVEATAIERIGRITHGCLGLYSDNNIAALDRVLNPARRVSPAGTKWGIQIAHSGRKGSQQRPWDGGAALRPGEDPWETVSASALPFGDWHVPGEATADDMTRIRAAFVETAKRSVDLGFEVIELHCAHGYLLHEFLSPLSNQRTDGYGGSVENRMRFPLEIARAVREAVPGELVFGARITGTDWHEDGTDLEEAATFAGALKTAGLDYVCVSSGGLVPGLKIPVEPGYQLRYAAGIRERAGIATRAVGMIADPHPAEEIIASGQADMLALARGFIDNPRWPWHAAEALGAGMTVPPQYLRGHAPNWPGAKLARPTWGDGRTGRVIVPS
jgi:2,4-dienoyl-CoA reductase-like NADH-dependent reductase (Old Yellow Enzyme family)